MADGSVKEVDATITNLKNIVPRTDEGFNPDIEKKRVKAFKQLAYDIERGKVQPKDIESATENVFNKFDKVYADLEPKSTPLVSSSNDNTVDFMFDDGSGLSPDWSNFYDVKPARTNIAEKTIQNIINRAPTPALTEADSESDTDSIQTALEQEDMLPDWD